MSECKSALELLIENEDASDQFQQEILQQQTGRERESLERREGQKRGALMEVILLLFSKREMSSK